MKIASVRYAVDSFLELRGQFLEVIQTLGLQALVCMVRQHHVDVDRGWAFFEVGLDRVSSHSDADDVVDYVFWGKMEEERAGKHKEVMVILDPETIDSIEFEVYNPESGDLDS